MRRGPAVLGQPAPTSVSGPRWGPPQARRPPRGTADWLLPSLLLRELTRRTRTLAKPARRAKRGSAGGRGGPPNGRGRATNGDRPGPSGDQLRRLRLRLGVSARVRALAGVAAGSRSSLTPAGSAVLPPRWRRSSTWAARRARNSAEDGHGSARPQRQARGGAAGPPAGGREAD